MANKAPYMSGVNQVMSERSAFMGRTCGQLGSELKHLVLLYLKQLYNDLISIP